MRTRTEAGAGLLFWLLVTLAMLSSPAARGAIVMQDASGQEVQLAGPARRVVSLAPYLTELLFDLGAGDRLVGTIDPSDYPAAAARIPRVGTYDRLDYERIVALRPDLVLLWLSGNGRDELEHLRHLGLKVFAMEPRHLDGIARSLERLGELVGKTDQGRQEARDYRNRLAKLTHDYSRRKPVRVFFQIWSQPLMTVGGPQLITSVLKRCGGRNIFADQPQPALTVSTEAVIRRKPQAIVATAGAGPNPLARWRRLKGIPAVQNQNLILLNTQTLGRATPRVLEGMRQLCRALDQTR